MEKGLGTNQQKKEFSVIAGYATEAATKNYLQNHRQLAGSTIGTTMLSVGQAGFGCYRVSVGVATYPADSPDLRELVKCADTDMYRNKELQRPPTAESGKVAYRKRKSDD